MLSALSDSMSLLPMSNMSVDQTCVTSTPCPSPSTPTREAPYQTIETQTTPPRETPSQTSVTQTTPSPEAPSQTSETQTMPVQKVDKESQVTVQVSDKEQQTLLSNIKEDFEFALFRSNGNLSVLSNFHVSRLHYRGRTFKSAEHAYQHSMAMFHNCPHTARKIIYARFPAYAKKLAGEVRKCEQWHEAKTTIMAEILSAKAQQCPAFRRTLLGSQNKIL